MVDIIELLRSIVAVRRIVSRQKHAGESWAAAFTTANALEAQVLVRGSAAVEPLASALLDHDRDLTQLAATLLFRLDEERARTAAEAAILAGKFFSDVTAFADARQLAEAMCDHGSAALLVRLRVDKGMQYVLGAEQTLARTDPARVRGAALPPARPQAEEVRKERCKTLGQHGGHGAFETLAQAALNDQDWGVRLEAVRALGVLADPRGAAVVEQIVEAHYVFQKVRQDVLRFFHEQATRGFTYAAAARALRELEELKTWLEDREFPNWDILERERAKVAASGYALVEPTLDVALGAFLYDLAGSLDDLGNTQGESGQWEGALASAQEAIDIRRTLAQSRPVVSLFLRDLAVSLDNRGKIQSELGQHEAAVASEEEALETIWPLFLDRPAAFERSTAVIIGHVLECLESLGRPPSPELLARIETFNARRDVAALALSERAGAGRG